jgi:hypothetical protein
MIKPFTILSLSLIISSSLNAQIEYNTRVKDIGDTIKPLASLQHSIAEINERRRLIKSLILPAGMITYGFIALENDGLKNLDNSIKQEIWMEHPHKPIVVDNYLQYAPAVAVYGLNAIGIKGKNNFRDRTMIYLLSNAMMGITVQSLKSITRVQRPDGFGTNAFPSGHTATAFVAAEFLHQEYRDVSPWYGIAGYAMATTTAYMRMYNNRHWFRDLAPGAGIGIVSTKLAYWVYPVIKRKLFKDKPMNTIVMPFYQNNTIGVSLIHSFDKKINRQFYFY